MAGHIIAIVAGKDGVGKSVLATNLALAFLKEFGARTLLVDQDALAERDQDIILGLKQTPSIGLREACNHTGSYDTTIISKMVTKHSSGLHYLPASTRDTEVPLDGLGKFYKSIVNFYPYIIVDCGSIMNAYTIKALEFSTTIFLVTTPDILVTRQNKLIFNEISKNLFPPELVQIILNRANPLAPLNAASIQRNLGRPVIAQIPDDPQINDRALANGSPVLLSARQSTTARAFHELVRKIEQTKLLQKLSRIRRAPIKRIANVSQSLLTSNKQQTMDRTFDSKRKEELDPRSKLKIRVHKELVEKVEEFKKKNISTKEKAHLREKCKIAVIDILNKEDISHIAQGRTALQSLVKEILDEALGLGPLEDLLADKSISEIMVIARDRIYCERGGKNMLSKTTFSSNQQLMNIIERIVMPLGRRIDEKTPYVDARLPDGSRVHAIIPPLAIRGPTITIRKFASERMTWKHLVQFSSLTQEISDFLRLCVEARLNIVVSGGTGSGKTTLLNVLSNFIPSSDRIITCEDAAELDLAQDHVVRLETRPPNIEGSGAVTIRDLVKQSLRMKPDRVIVGECRAGEALDMLQAMNTGHDGSLTTVHSNSPRDCISRIETLVTMAGSGLPTKAIREQIAGAIDLIVQQTRLPDGSRKITYITEVTGIQNDTVSLQDIFTYKRTGIDKRHKITGKFIPTGFIPKFIEDIEEKGMKISRSLFSTQNQSESNVRKIQPGSVSKTSEVKKIYPSKK